MTKAVGLTLTDTNEELWGVLSFHPSYNRQLLSVTASPQNQAATSRPTLGLTSSAFAIESKIRSKNYAKATFILQGRAYYNWRVSVDEPI